MMQHQPIRAAEAPADSVSAGVSPLAHTVRVEHVEDVNVRGVALERRQVQRRSPKKEAVLKWLVEHPEDVSTNYRELPDKLAQSGAVKTNHVTVKDIQEAVVSRALADALARGEQETPGSIMTRLDLLADAARQILSEIAP